MRFGLIKNRVLPEPEPPTTSTFLFRANAGFFGLPDIIKPSVAVNIMLFHLSASMYGAISFLIPQRALPYSTFLRYFLAFLLLTYTISLTTAAPIIPIRTSINAEGKK